jgi:hypothetical protein
MGHMGVLCRRNILSLRDLLYSEEYRNLRHFNCSFGVSSFIPFLAAVLENTMHKPTLPYLEIIRTRSPGYNPSYDARGSVYRTQVVT